MSHDIYLSYSGRRFYIDCPKEYWYKYVVKDKTRIDPRGTFFGSAIGKVFEWFYENQVWAMKDPVASSRAMIDPAIDVTFRHDGYRPDSEPDLRREIREDMWNLIPAGIEAIKKFGFLTEDSRAEVDLSVTIGHKDYDFTLRMVGWADFIHGHGDNRWIVDGKGTAHREKYVDADQVIWYALLHYLKFRVAPSRIGFLYWKFPEDPVEWVKYDGDDMRRVYIETFEVAKRIRLEMFDPTPGERCPRCDHRNQCDEGRQYLADRQVEARNEINTSMFDLEQII